MVCVWRCPLECARAHTLYTGRALGKSTCLQIQRHRIINHAHGLKRLWSFSIYKLKPKLRFNTLWFFPLMFCRGVEWGPFRVLSAEHRHASETEGNPHFYSKGKTVSSTQCTFTQGWPPSRNCITQLYLPVTVGRFLNSWETGLQTALYLHIIPNHNSMLQVRSEQLHLSRIESCLL